VTPESPFARFTDCLQNPGEMDDHPLNILYLTDRCDRGEAAMIKGVHDHGMNVRVFGRLDSPYVQGLRGHGISIEDLRWDKPLNFTTLKRIRRVVVEHNIDIIHSLNSRTTLHMVLATRPLHRRGQSPKLVAYLGVTGNVSWLSPLSWIRFLNPRIDRIVCVAEGVRQYLLDVRFLNLKLDPNKVVTIHKGHELEWYQAKPTDLAQFDIPTGAMTVTVASRLRPRKGLLQVVRALGLTDPAKNIHLLFLGHAGNEEILRAVAALPHPERVHFAGFRRDAPEIMAASDVCCLPVLSGEGLSRAVIEGMAYGVAPLVTDVGGNTELVIDGECGLVVRAGDEAQLAQAMEYYYDHPAERTHMGQAARERIAEHFRSEDTVRKVLGLYRDLTTSRPGV
jgi:glycosyltransferase involved in cell wall biosynthesis